MSRTGAWALHRRAHPILSLQGQDLCLGLRARGGCPAKPASSEYAGGDCANPYDRMRTVCADDLVESLREHGIDRDLA